MQKKINIAELLKDCPQGMELDCTVYDNCVLEGIVEDGCCYPIQIKTPEGLMPLTQYGSISPSMHSKCVIFPKGKTTWDGFVPSCPFKDGDILTYTSNYTTTFIYRNKDNEPNFSTSFYVACNNAPSNNFLIYNKNTLIALNENCDVRLATEKEKQKLFDVIKENGYKWNADKKTLEKLIVPKFKVGDTITNGKTSITIGYIDNEYYYEISRNIANRLFIKNQDEWNLISDKFPNKFDINTLVPFESRVLVRDSVKEPWKPYFFGCLSGNNNYPYIVIGGIMWKCCIPYKNNEHLLWTTNDCSDYYKTWE